jgi:hypothetical protein
MQSPSGISRFVHVAYYSALYSKLTGDTCRGLYGRFFKPKMFVRGLEFLFAEPGYFFFFTSDNKLSIQTKSFAKSFEDGVLHVSFHSACFESEKFCLPLCKGENTKLDSAFCAAF